MDGDAEGDASTAAAVAKVGRTLAEIIADLASDACIEPVSGDLAAKLAELGIDVPSDDAPGPPPTPPPAARSKPNPKPPPRAYHPSPSDPPPRRPSGRAPTTRVGDDAPPPTIPRATKKSANKTDAAAVRGFAGSSKRSSKRRPSLRLPDYSRAATVPSDPLGVVPLGVASREILHLGCVRERAHYGPWAHLWWSRGGGGDKGGDDASSKKHRPPALPRGPGGAFDADAETDGRRRREDHRLLSEGAGALPLWARRVARREGRGRAPRGRGDVPRPRASLGRRPNASVRGGSSVEYSSRLGTTVGGPGVPRVVRTVRPRVREGGGGVREGDEYKCDQGRCARGFVVSVVVVVLGRRRRAFGSVRARCLPRVGRSRALDGAPGHGASRRDAEEARANLVAAMLFARCRSPARPSRCPPRTNSSASPTSTARATSGARASRSASSRCSAGSRP